MIVPCVLCGYHAPLATCPHCGHAPREARLRAPVSGAMAGFVAGLEAVPRGLVVLLRTRGVKRWLLPPLVLTVTALVLVLVWGYSALSGVLHDSLPEGVELAPPDWDWLRGAEWLAGVVAWVVSAAEWTLNAAYALLANRVSGLLVYAFLGVFASWYVFSIAYEAVAGPFLDEIQGRLETGWFGTNPRDALERPTDIPAARCLRISLAALGAGSVVVVLAATTPIPALVGFVALPAAVAAGVLYDRRYGTWLAWMARVEGGAVVASLKAALLSFAILAVAWPVYFLPFPVGYALFAVVCGFATAVSLLDIPCERRGWSTGQRFRFVRRNLLAFVAFGTVAGFLLAVPVVGWLLMVPAASIGGLWLLCRLDKGLLRPPATGA